MKLIERYIGTSLVLRILVGLALGIAFALLCPGATFIKLFGTLFVSSLKAIAPVLVFFLVAASIAKAKEGQGKRFRLVIILYLASTLLAACLSVVASYLFPVTISLSGVAAEGGSHSSLGGVFDTLVSSMVMNPVAAIAEANYIAVLFWAVILGLALKALGSSKAVGVLSDVGDACSKMVGWIIQFAPFGIFGLVFGTVSSRGVSIFAEYGKLLALLVGCMAFTALVINPILVAILIHRNPYPLVLRCLKDSGISAFFTRSSAANIPVNLELCRKMGLDEGFYSVSIPLGSTINMNGAAVTITVMSLAVCHTLGIEVGIGSAILLSIMATLGACGSSGVAGGSLLLIPMACSLFGVSDDIAMQAVGVGFIISVVQDSVETALNSSADVVFTSAVMLREKYRKEKSK